MASHYYVPDDLLEEVFHRLPGKCLVRFKCLSKTWYHRISGLKFKSQTVALLSRRIQSINDEGEVDIPWKNINKGSPLIAGSCNGLLLLVFEKRYYTFLSFSFVMWNPFTQYYDQVLTYDSVDDEYYYYKCFGFCYDFYTDDYKVLVVFKRPPNYFGSRVLVGSVKTKQWIKIWPYYDFSSALGGPIVQWHVHWLVRPLKKHPYITVDVDPVTHESRKIVISPPKYVIVYFDPAMNVFNEVSIPRIDDEVVICGLSVLDDCLCITLRLKDYRYELMIMKEYGVAESWTALFSFSYMGTDFLCRELVPICFTKGGDFLMWIDVGRDVRGLVEKVVLEFYNPKSYSWKKIQKLDLEPDCLTGVATYEQSLFSAPGLNMVELCENQEEEEEELGNEEYLPDDDYNGRKKKKNKKYRKNNRRKQ